MRIAIVMTPEELRDYIESLPEPLKSDYRAGLEGKAVFFHHQLDIPIYVFPRS